MIWCTRHMVYELKFEVINKLRMNGEPFIYLDVIIHDVLVHFLNAMWNGIKNKNIQLKDVSKLSYPSRKILYFNFSLNNISNSNSYNGFRYSIPYDWEGDKKEIHFELVGQRKHSPNLYTFPKNCPEIFRKTRHYPGINRLQGYLCILHNSFRVLEEQVTRGGKPLKLVNPNFYMRR
jgi:hypothetical protein